MKIKIKVSNTVLYFNRNVKIEQKIIIFVIFLILFKFQYYIIASSKSLKIFTTVTIS